MGKNQNSQPGGFVILIFSDETLNNYSDDGDGEKVDEIRDSEIMKDNSFELRYLSYRWFIF